jgi:hypothetical protein
MAAEVRATAGRRLKLLSGELDAAIGKDSAPTGTVTLVSEYLAAVEAVAYLNLQDKKEAEAMEVYRRAFEAQGFITGKIYNPKILRYYVKTLNNYRGLLDKHGPTAEAAKVAASAQRLDGMLKETQRIQYMQNRQQTLQGPSQMAAAP